VYRVQGGGVSARYRKCGGGGPWIWVGWEPYIDRELCLLRTMSRMGYVKICFHGKCSYI
jgi:hypothetical protein